MSETTDQELLRRAHDLRKEASQLLSQEGLFPLVAAVGPASVRGSFALDLNASSNFVSLKEFVITCNEKG